MNQEELPLASLMCGCLVHDKRKFHEALVASPDNEIAKTGEKYLLKLFAIEEKATKEQLSLDDRLTLRQNNSKAIIEEFYNWIESIESQTLP